jgi:hypothetical protein
MAASSTTVRAAHDTLAQPRNQDNQKTADLEAGKTGGPRNPPH